MRLFVGQVYEGSNPLRHRLSVVAQLADHRVLAPKVRGSNPLHEEYRGEALDDRDYWEV